MARRFAATDLHGCLRTFRYLVEEELQLRPDDHLYLLGDYVNKGPDSAGVLDYLMQLQATGYQVQCLRGNHDQKLLDTIFSRGDGDMWRTPAEQAMTLASFGVARPSQIAPRYVQWLAALPLQLELPDFLLVHAGFNFALPPAEMRRDTYSMLYTKHFTYDPSRQAPAARPRAHAGGRGVGQRGGPGRRYRPRHRWGVPPQPRAAPPGRAQLR